MSVSTELFDSALLPLSSRYSFLFTDGRSLWSVEDGEGDEYSDDEFMLLAWVKASCSGGGTASSLLRI